jgi:hypothetical protein
MISLKKQKQQGATLLVGMIMMVVLTLLVVFSLRSGNTNLRIAGNMQTQSEANAATQQVIEQVIEQIKDTEDLSLIPAQSVPVTMGNVTYTVAVAAMDKCVMEIPVLNSSLDPMKPNDVPCFETPDGEKALKPDGTLTTKPSACKTQQWDIEAGVTDGTSGTKVTQVQGISIRVPATVDCL